MKIAKFELCDFRGFPGPETYTFNLAGKNLLLYGENGSGKSSLFRALVEFFTLDPLAKSFDDHRNIFSAYPGASTIAGHVTLEFTDSSRFAWNSAGQRPRTDYAVASVSREMLTDAARRAALLEYRSLLRTNYGIVNLRTSLFELAVNTLLTNVPVTLPGAPETTIGQLWNRLLNSKPRRHSPRTLADVAAAGKAFNDGFRAVLPDVVQRTSEFLNYFNNAGLDLSLSLPGVKYDGTWVLTRDREFVDREIDMQITLRGVAIAEWNRFLNEARLSALAISLFFASAVLSNPRPPISVTTPLKLLVLDDVLIGLDHSNRLPVLKILEEKFADYQIMLFTHDRVWFEMAQLALMAPEKWVSYEMHSGSTNHAGLIVDTPIHRPSNEKNPADHFLTLAEEHLNNHHDARTAALHARVAFEVKLKSYCSKQKVQVPFDLDGRHLNTDHFLTAIERRLNWKGKMPLALFSLQRVKLFRDGVLNPLAHFHPVTLAPAEVAAAIQAVRSLEFGGKRGAFAPTAHQLLSKPSPSSTELLDAACYLRTAFEVDLREVLVRHNGRMPYKHDPTDVTLAELWDAAKEAMNRVNATNATPLITDIESRRSVFLDDWRYDRVSALKHAELNAAWTALRDTSTSSVKTRLISNSRHSTIPPLGHKYDRPHRPRQEESRVARIRSRSRRVLPPPQARSHRPHRSAAPR